MVDNRAAPGLIGEHGLSLWIEAEGKHILFDTGQGGAFEANARALGVDISKTDILVLSHGHYDHTGGIPQVLKAAGGVEVYCHQGVVAPRFSIRNGTPKPIQMPSESIAAIDNLPAHGIHWVSEPVLVSERIGVTGPIPRETNYEDTGGPFYLDPAGKQADPIDDDLALWITTQDGLIVCVGCCHAGLVNTLNYIRRISKDTRIRSVIGGFHLRSASSQRLDRTVAVLQSLKPETVVPCHCTGENAVAALCRALGSRVSPGAAGETYRF